MSVLCPVLLGNRGRDRAIYHAHEHSFYHHPIRHHLGGIMLKKVKSALAFIVTFGWLVFTFRAIHGIITAKEAEVVCLWFIAWGFPAVFILIMQESP